MSKVIKSNADFFPRGIDVDFLNQTDIDEFEGIYGCWHVHSKKNGMLMLANYDDSVRTEVSPDRVMPNCDIATYARTAVKNGSNFSIDLVNKTITIGKTTIMEKGKTVFPFYVEQLTCKQVLEKIEDLYRKYSHSIPSKEDCGKHKCYFTALPEKELDNDDMLYGVSRNTAQLELELFVLLQSLYGSLNWSQPEFERCNWFWQSENNKSLVILKQWISTAHE